MSSASSTSIFSRSASLSFIVVFSCQVCPLVIVARVCVGIIIIFFIPFIPAFPRNTARIGTFPKVAKQPTAFIAEFLLHDPQCYTHRSFLLLIFWHDSQ